jgi:hypothetical protein
MGEQSLVPFTLAFVGGFVFTTPYSLLPVFPHVTIHHLPLDANFYSFYSLPIFGTLAPLANPVAVKKAHPLRCNQSPVSIHPISRVVRQFNPASSDGGQHTT